MIKHAVASETSAKETVLSLVKALNNEDFDTARTYADDSMTFEGVLGSRNGADAYFEDMRHMKMKYHIIKVLADSTDVCLFYNLDMSGVNIFGCGWYHVQDGKITSLKVIFDPRPVLEAKNKK